MGAIGAAGTWLSFVRSRLPERKKALSMMQTRESGTPTPIKQLAVQATFTRQTLRLTNHREHAVTDVRFSVDGKSPAASLWFMANEPESVPLLDAGQSYEFLLGPLEYIPRAPRVLTTWVDENGDPGEWSREVLRPFS